MIFVGTPVFIARAGALARNLPIALVNQPEGLHAFDLYQDSAMSRDVVRSVLAFLQSHLR